MTNPQPVVPSIGAGAFPVDAPGGLGQLFLQSPEEVNLFETSRDRYQEDFHLTKTNDLVLLGAILQQQIVMFRAQRKINGMEPEVDAGNVPTGKYVMVSADAEEISGALKQLTTATDQIRAIEKALGIDKVTRESGGQHTVANYLQTLKRAAHERGIFITKRTLAYENFVNDLRVRVRVLLNHDSEDRHHMGISQESMWEWVQGELVKLEQIDKDYARERGKLFTGKL